MNATKANTYRIYLNEDDARQMKDIAEFTELGHTELLSKLVSSGLRCLTENNKRIPLPLKFRIDDGHSYRLNDAPLKKSRH